METKTGLDDICEIKEACLFRRIGWLKENAKVNEDIRTLYDDLEGAHEKIGMCFKNKGSSSRLKVCVPEN